MKKTLALILAGTTLALSTGMPVIAVEENASLTAAEAYVQQSTVYHYPITLQMIRNGWNLILLSICARLVESLRKC